MNKPLLLSAILAATIAFTSCASVSSSAVGFSEENFQGPNDAVIYVYRVKNLVGALVPWNVRLDGKIVGVLRQNSYVVLHTNPGVHTILIGDRENTWIALGPIAGAVSDVMIENADLKHGTFNAAANQKYYFRSKGFSVTVLPREEAIGELQGMKLEPGT